MLGDRLEPKARVCPILRFETYLGIMNKHLLGAIILVPVLVFSGTSGAGAYCNYTRPELVYKQACVSDACMKAVREHLPACKQQLAGQLSKTIRHSEGAATAPYLSLAVMDQLTDCIGSAGFGQFDRNSVDMSKFSEVSSDVRADKAQRVGGACKEAPCSGVFVYPVIGKTTFLYGPA